MRKLERTVGPPLYRQLADWIREVVRSGELPVGTRLGNLREIADNHEVKSNVAAKALEELGIEGWVRKNAEGIYQSCRPREIAGALLKWDPAGLVLEADAPIEIRVLSKVTTSLTTDLLKIFEVHGLDGKQASRVIKLHQSGNLSLALETITAPACELPGLVMKDHRHTNVYAIIREQYRIEIESVEQRIHQRMLKPEEANNLAATPNFPALCLDRIVRSATQAVAYIEWVIPAGRCRVREEGFRT